MLSLVFSKMCAIEKQNNRILKRLKQLQEIADEDFKEVAFKVKINKYIFLQNAFSKRTLFFRISQHHQQQWRTLIATRKSSNQEVKPIDPDPKPYNYKTSWHQTDNSPNFFLSWRATWTNHKINPFKKGWRRRNGWELNRLHGNDGRYHG